MAFGRTTDILYLLTSAVELLNDHKLMQLAMKLNCTPASSAAWRDFSVHLHG